MSWSTPLWRRICSPTALVELLRLLFYALLDLYFGWVAPITNPLVRLPSLQPSGVARFVLMLTHGWSVRISCRLYSRSWPLTIFFYIPFCVPLEAAFYLQVRRFVRERSHAPNTMFSQEAAHEALRCWESLIKEESPATVAQTVRGWFLVAAGALRTKGRAPTTSSN